MITKLPRLGALILLTAGAVWPGCGRIADPNQIQIATLDGKPIRRADLNRVIWQMDDDDRPNIRHKGDLLRVLNNYIDDQITVPLGRQLALEKKIETSREAARERYFESLGDRAEQQRAIWGMEVPPPGVTTPLMDVYDLTPEVLRAQKDYIEQETDLVQEQMQAEQAVQYLAVEAFKKGELVVSDAVLQREYNLNRDSFQGLETMVFRAVRFLASDREAMPKATAVRTRIDQGETFDAIVDLMLQAAPGNVIESEIENNPAAERFHAFWQEASGAEPGAIIGPVYMPELQQIGRDETGKLVPKIVPDSYMVLKVLERRDAKELTLEQAKPMLVSRVLVGEMMKKLHADRGVQIFEDKLPDPAEFMDPTQDPLMQ